MANKLQLAIDFGGSSTKVLAYTGEQATAFAMRSEVVEVPKDILLGREKFNTARNPLHCAYVSCGSKYYAVGTLA